MLTRKNALRHGLAVRLAVLPQSKDMSCLVRAILGENDSALKLEQAITVAETELDLRRIRVAHCTIVDQAATGPETCWAVSDQIVDALVKIDRYERRALSRRKSAIRKLSELSSRAPYRKNS